MLGKATCLKERTYTETTFCKSFQAMLHAAALDTEKLNFTFTFAIRCKYK